MVLKNVFSDATSDDNVPGKRIVYTPKSPGKPPYEYDVDNDVVTTSSWIPAGGMSSAQGTKSVFLVDDHFKEIEGQHRLFRPFQLQERLFVLRCPSQLPKSVQNLFYHNWKLD